MATRSTASSGTDPQDPEERSDAADPSEALPAPAGGQARPAHDAERRAFFFQFGRQAVSAVGQVAGMADIVGRTSNALAGELLGLEEPQGPGRPGAFARSGVSSDPVVTAAAPAAEDSFRSAYRRSHEGLVILDQRRLPEALEEVVAVRGSDVAYYLRLGVARGGPLMAQLAAYGLALTATERADQPAEQRQLELRRTARALIEARVSSRLLAWAVERMEAVVRSSGEDTPGTEVAAALHAEADKIAAEFTAGEAAMATTLSEALLQPDRAPVTLLLHGAHGSLIAGQLGAGVTALGRMQAAGRELRVFVTEGRPFMDGARLAAWELRQAGVEHRLIPDAAAAWLFEREAIDAIIVRAEWVAADGATSALIGAGALARLAAGAVHRPRVVVVGPAATLDPATPDGPAIPTEMRPARELSTYLADVPVRASDALVPAADVIAAELVDLRVTESGAEWGPERP